MIVEGANGHDSCFSGPNASSKTVLWMICLPLNVRQQLPCPLECHLSSFLHKFVDTSQLLACLFTKPVEYVTSPSPHSSCIGRHALYIMLCGFPLSYSAINRAKQVLKRSLRTNSTAMDVPKGCLAIYIGETQK